MDNFTNNSGIKTTSAPTSDILLGDTQPLFLMFPYLALALLFQAS